MGVSWADCKSKKLSFWGVIFSSFYTTTNHFLIRLWHAVKSGFYMTSGNDQLRGWTKKLQSTSKSQTCIRKRSWSLFDSLLPAWSTITFWIPLKPLHLRSMLSKLMRCTENCNTCSLHWSTERAQFSPWRRTTCHTNASKVKWTGLQSFASSAIFTWLLANHFFKHLNNFLQRKCFQEFVKSWSMDFYATGENISHWQKCVDCNGSYFD